MEDLLARVSTIGRERRVSRRDVLRFSIGASLSAAILPLLAACGGDDDDNTSTTSSSTTSSGTAASTTKTTGTGASTTGTSSSAATPGMTMTTSSGTTASGTGTTGSGTSKTATTGTGGTPGSGTGAKVAVTEKEFSVTASPTSVAAGNVTFDVDNQGAVEHQLVILKSDMDQAKLKMSSDGTTVDLTASGEEIGTIDKIAAGSTKSDSFDLKAGKYVLLCNLAGHYAAGMHAALTVT